MSAPEVWDSIPFLAKLQIIGAIGIFEHISEDKNFLAADGNNTNPNSAEPEPRTPNPNLNLNFAPTLTFALTRRQALHARRQAGLHAHLQVGPTLALTPTLALARAALLLAGRPPRVAS
jgi:hypothetical protein